jgi:hypothetical protein
MKKFVTLSPTMIVAAILFMLAGTPPAVASDVTYSFELTGPQAATNGTQTIRLTGAGSFDPAAGTVVASGSFTIANNSTGAVVSKGTWKATGFTSFCSRGGPNPGVQGGVLVLTVTLSPKGESPMTGLTMTVNCLVFGPPNNADTCSPVEGEGVTVADFTTIVSGHTLFHVND